MAIAKWNPERECTRQEELLLLRLIRTKKLFGFLRAHRHELFDDAFQDELATMYRDGGGGKAPVAPALMAMAVLLQGYVGASDAEAVELTVVDLRWQLVLGRLGATEPAFSQGALHDFRHRLIRAGLDRRLLDRTVELARTTRVFDWKKLPKTLAVAIDSSPLEGAGRVEDTINLLAHAARKALACAAILLDRPADEIAADAKAPLLLAGQSIKRALDLEWSDPEQKAGAVKALVTEVDSLVAWIRAHLPEEAERPPLAEHLVTIRQICDQDLEPDPSGGGPRVRQGVAEDRRVSIEDGEMRHGRKSKSKRFNGFKRHIAADLDTNLILACAITPANRPEEDATPLLTADLARGSQPRAVGKLYIDRGYIGSAMVQDVLTRRGEVFCKPWVPRNGKLFTKSDFVLDMQNRSITCPAGEVEYFVPGKTVEFDPETCAQCPLRSKCTMASAKAGRTVSISNNEDLQHQLRQQIATPKGRQRLRRRVAIEHRLAHVGQKQGRRARYRGVRPNLFDLRRASAVVNLETIHRLELAMAA